eukprot:CAMPEP_0180483278 /NCGR_PEP_ID=MMETSP1036_2-20121128/35338_1 /TAXON_ID=632150 /ORGANISM="Azadinium spinosum, Strain 3D9" /LENGTH=425 /DNA_ID=CAMNT_0022491077 /DNA_START=59 /DNA_END=1337 /DNA_ORIENTATION=+
MAEWQALLDRAEQAVKDDKFFDGVQYINKSMEDYARTVLGAEDDKVVKEPDEFLKSMAEKLTVEQKALLGKMYVVRGDIITGLGANKRASVDYACAETLGYTADSGLAKKKANAEDALKEQRRSDKVPVTIITGYLGAGKTTLLNRILKENHGKRIAVIENEFGEVGIDDALIEAGPMTTEENIVEMNNGCICCTVRGDLIAGLKKMVKNSQKTGKAIDAVLIETTGLADPAPVARVETKGVENEAVEQVAFADRILLNKTDLVDEAALDEVERRIRMINESVQIRRCQRSEVDMDFILGIHAFSLDKIMEMDDAFLADSVDHQHDSRVSSIGIDVQGEVDQNSLNDWLGWLLKERGADLFRTKGVLAVKGLKEKFVFQAVHMAFSGAPQKPWAEGEERFCRLIFIGKNLNREELLSGFTKCIAK